MINLNYEKLKIQSYIKTDSIITNDEKQLHFNLTPRCFHTQPIGSNTANKHFFKACVCIQCVVQISDSRQGGCRGRAVE